MKAVIYSCESGRLSQVQEVRNKIKLLLGTRDPRRESAHPKRLPERKGGTLAHGCMSHLSLGRSIFFTWVHPADTRSNETVSFPSQVTHGINSEAAESAVKQAEGAPYRQAAQFPWKSCFSAPGGKKLLVESHSLDHHQGHSPNLALWCPPRDPSQELCEGKGSVEGSAWDWPEHQ